jgi:hypothetical protein
MAKQRPHFAHRPSLLLSYNDQSLPHEEELARQRHQVYERSTRAAAEALKVLRNVRGAPDDEHDELLEVLSDEEMLAYAQLVREIKAEAIAAGETRLDLLREFDKVIAECEVSE